MTIGNADMPVDLGALEQQVNNVQSDVAEIKGALSQIAAAITKLAVLEERHQTTQMRVEKIEDRLVETVKKVADPGLTNGKQVATLNGVTSTIKVHRPAVLLTRNVKHTRKPTTTPRIKVQAQRRSELIVEAATERETP